MQGPRIDEIDVPLPLRRPFDALVAAQRRRMGKSVPYEPPPFRATIAWGRRLEPWIVDLSQVEAVVSPSPAPRRVR